MLDNLLSLVKPAPPIKPLFNTGANMDLFSGSYLTGKYGDSIINGGVDHITGAIGGGNSYKTTAMLHQQLTVLNRYGGAALTYGTEGTLQITRPMGLAKHYNPQLLENGVLADPKKYVLTSSQIYDGTEYYNLSKVIGYKRIGDNGAGMRDTPFIHPTTGEPIKCYPPITNLIDSFSLFHSGNMQDIQNQDIGDSKRNMEAMRDGHSKTQMLIELPTFCSKVNMCFFLTAHLGDKYMLNPMEKPRKKLSFLQANLTIKNVTEKFTFVTNNLWYFIRAVPSYNNTSERLPRFPRSPHDGEKDDKDLQEIDVVNLRPKSASGGFVFKLMTSQRDGILPYVTNYMLCNDNNYGIGGNNTTWHLELYPELKCNRKQLRTKQDEDAKFARAAELSAELCQYFLINPDIQSDFRCTGEELYNDLIKLGYDWDRILTNTRSYWTFDHYTNPIRPITALDLLNMRAGIYRPWWWDMDTKKTA